MVNETYRDNLKKLKNFVMIMFKNDTIVQPKETEFFAYYVPGQDRVIQPLNETRLYLEVSASIFGKLKQTLL